MSEVASTSASAPTAATSATPRKRKAVDEPNGHASGSNYDTNDLAASKDNGDGTEASADATTAAESAPPASKRVRNRGRGRGAAASRGAGTATTRGRGRGRGRGRAKARSRRRDSDEDEEEEESEDSSAEEDGSDAEFAIQTAPTRTASGRRTRPTTKAVDMHRLSGGSGSSKRPSPAPSATPTTVAWDDQYEKKMKPAGPDELARSSTVTQQQVVQDLAFPAFARVGELVWVRVPLGPPPAGALANAQLSRWPGIIRGRTVVENAGATEESYQVELLGMSSLDTLSGVRAENVAAWLSYIPSNTVYLDSTPLENDGLAAGDTKKRWATIQSEGWIGVANAFRKAQRIAKAYAAIQIRPIPQLRVGSHLAAAPDGPTDDLDKLERKDAQSRYLSYSHILCGPEILHAGDFVRLRRGAQIVANTRTFAETGLEIPTSLIMRVGSFYRGEDRSPLMARGLLFELVVSKPDDRTYDRSLYALPPDIRVSLPPPLPGHKWKLVREPGVSGNAGSARDFETNVIFDAAVAGRLYPISPEWPINRDPMQLGIYLAEALRVKKATPGMGEEGLRALAVMLGGMSGADRTVAFKASTYLAGDRKAQLVAAEEQALGVKPEQER